MKQNSKQQQDELVYETLLTLGRDKCQNTKIIDFFKQKIRETTIKVNMHKRVAQPKDSQAQLLAQHSRIITKGEKRKLDHEEKTDDFQHGR